MYMYYYMYMYKQYNPQYGRVSYNQSSYFLIVTDLPNRKLSECV